MRVLHVTSTFPRWDGDPVGPYLAELCAAEQDAGLQVRAVVPHAPGLAVEDRVRGVPVWRFRYGPEGAEVLAYGAGLLATARTPAGAAMVPAYLAAMAAAVRRQVREFRPDVVHAHWWFPGGLAALAATRRPVVVTLHGSDVAIAHRAGVRAAARAVLGRTAAAVAVSEALADEARALVGHPVGVAVMPVRVTPPAAVAAPQPDRVRLVSVARLSREKGLDVLLEAVRVTSARGVPVEWTVVGEGPERGGLEQAAAAGGIRVTFTGNLAPAERDARVAAADALVVPSRREGMGLVAVEAVLLGTPVVASHTGGLPAALGDPVAPPPAAGQVQPAPGGLLVRPGDVEGLVAAIGRVPGLGRPGGAALAAHQ